MGRFLASGGKRLSGELRVCGAKNAALPIFAASLLTDEHVRLYDCPEISDADNMLEILATLGCKVQRDGNTVDIDPSSAESYTMPPSISKRLRSSIFMLGPVLGRFKRAHFTYPGGCEIGSRPIDLHLSGLAKLNVLIKEEHGCIECIGDDMRGSEVHLDYPSVGATENIMMAAVAAKGDSIIYNAAREPEIVDLQDFMNKQGFHINGAGTSTIFVRSGCSKREVEHRIIPDRIVAGTLLCAAAMTKGEITLTNADPSHMISVLSKLREAGCEINTDGDLINLRSHGRPGEISIIETLPYPGFPTDMQSQMFALCCVSSGTSIIVENVFENRFKCAPELSRMGAKITMKDRTAVVRGVGKLTGAVVNAKDLRGGAALVLAALAAEGDSVIYGSEYIDRGYERLDLMMSRLGADIRKDEGNE